MSDSFFNIDIPDGLPAAAIRRRMDEAAVIAITRHLLSQSLVRDILPVPDVHVTMDMGPSGGVVTIEQAPHVSTSAEWVAWLEANLRPIVATAYAAGKCWPIWHTDQPEKYFV